MFILHLLPDAFLEFIVNAILLIGVLSTFVSFVILNQVLRFFPALAAYYRIAQLVSITILLAGVYFKGGYSTEMLWRGRVEEAESKVAKAEAQAKQINDELDAERKKKNKVIKEYAVTVKERIVEKDRVINADCRVAPDAVTILNDSAKGPKK